ncbi:MAG: endo,3,4-beta-glycanase [Candidatus Eremiobacteraeota bacterium]|nr:endo,3,4-beta-glycanase [Candidatus Eremiobacteraeota bacterium]
MIRTLASVLFCSLVTGCGGGGGVQTMPPQSPVAKPSGSTTAGATLTVTIPSASKTGTAKRRARYVSSATNSLSFTPTGGTTTVVPLTATSPNCTTDASGARSCAISVSAPTGSNVTFSLSTFASADGIGTPLSTTLVSQAIVANQTNPINVTLDAVVSQLQVGSSNSAFVIGQASSATVTVNLLDAAGKIIAVGINNLVDASDSPVVVSLTDSESNTTQLSGTTLGSTGAVSLTYNGATPSVGSATISARASSPASPSLATASATINFSAPGLPGTLTYNSSNMCVNHALYTNNVLPAGVGEFQTNGLDRSYWGGTKTRTVNVGNNPGGSWGPGFMTSWGRHQYDTYFGDSSDGLGYDPFTVANDNAAPGNPQGVRIEAMPVPSSIATSLDLMANDQYIVTSATSPYTVPIEGGTLVVNVANPNGAQNNWKVGMGYKGGATTFIGTLTSGGATPSGNGTGGTNPWTISNIHIYSGVPGTTITPGVNDEGGLRSYNFPRYYSGVLDTNINQQYGFFVSRIRLPNYLPALSPAFWTLETGGVANPPTGLQRDELDIEEMFANDFGNALNAGEILWNTSLTNGGKGVYNFPGGTPQSDYHDYGALVTPQGTSFYLDGVPIPGDTNEPDWTQGSPDKEVMIMFQVGAPGSWLDGNSTAMKNNPWPQYMWIQYLRIYKPTTTSC